MYDLPQQFTPTPFVPQPQLGEVGPQAVFLIALVLVGVEGVTPPLLPRRPPR